MKTTTLLITLLVSLNTFANGGVVDVGSGSLSKKLKCEVSTPVYETTADGYSIEKGSKVIASQTEKFSLGANNVASAEIHNFKFSDANIQFTMSANGANLPALPGGFLPETNQLFMFIELAGGIRLIVAPTEEEASPKKLKSNQTFYHTNKTYNASCEIIE